MAYLCITVVQHLVQAVFFAFRWHQTIFFQNHKNHSITIITKNGYYGYNGENGYYGANGYTTITNHSLFSQPITITILTI